MTTQASSCIFCLARVEPNAPVEHIVPESLGGGEWSVLTNRSLCGKCQNYFGTQVEQFVLDDHPFKFLRVFSGVPTKRGRMPILDDKLEGEFQRDSPFGPLRYKPSVERASQIEVGVKSRFRILAEPKNPRLVCRFLLKMGVGLIACDPQNDLGEVNEAREFARFGSPSKKWWYLEATDPERLGFVGQELGPPVADEEFASLSIVCVKPGAEIVHFRIGPFDLICPLFGEIRPDSDLKMCAPAWRLFEV